MDSDIEHTKGTESRFDSIDSEDLSNLASSQLSVSSSAMATKSGAKTEVHHAVGRSSQPEPIADGRNSLDEEILAAAVRIVQGMVRNAKAGMQPQTDQPQGFKVSKGTQLRGFKDYKTVVGPDKAAPGEDQRDDVDQVTEAADHRGYKFFKNGRIVKDKVQFPFARDWYQRPEIWYRPWEYRTRSVKRRYRPNPVAQYVARKYLKQERKNAAYGGGLTKADFEREGSKYDPSTRTYSDPPPMPTGSPTRGTGGGFTNPTQGAGGLTSGVPVPEVKAQDSTAQHKIPRHVRDPWMDPAGLFSHDPVQTSPWFYSKGRHWDPYSPEAPKEDYDHALAKPKLKQGLMSRGKNKKWQSMPDAQWGWQHQFGNWDPDGSDNNRLLFGNLAGNMSPKRKSRPFFSGGTFSKALNRKTGGGFSPLNRKSGGGFSPLNGKSGGGFSPENEKSDGGGGSSPEKNNPDANGEKDAEKEDGADQDQDQDAEDEQGMVSKHPWELTWAFGPDLEGDTFPNWDLIEPNFTKPILNEFADYGERTEKNQKLVFGDNHGWLRQRTNAPIERNWNIVQDSMVDPDTEHHLLHLRGYGPSAAVTYAQAVSPPSSENESPLSTYWDSDFKHVDGQGKEAGEVGDSPDGSSEWGFKPQSEEVS